MALVLKNRVLETCTSPGTGTVTLLGATTGYQTFSATVGNGNTCYYTIADQGSANWEVGIGTYATTGNTLTRNTVLSSSNGGGLTNFSTGTQNVFVDYPAEKAVYLDASGNAIPLGSASATQLDITAQGDLRLQDTTGGEYVALQAPATIASSYTLTLPVDDGTAGQALVTDGSGVLSWSTAASGDVYGPASATDNAVARFDLTTGKIIQNSVVTIADTTGNMAGVGTLSSGAITSSSLTSSRVLYAGTSGLIQDSANMTFNGTTFVLANDATINGQTVGKGGSAVATNTAHGTSALSANTSGNNNTAIGYQTLNAALTASSNVAIGSQALLVNTAGNGDVAIGQLALAATTVGALVAVGTQSLQKNTTGTNNTAVGHLSLQNNLTGSYNSAFGYRAMDANTNASRNTAIGDETLYSNTTGSDNLALGYRALLNNITGTSNAAVGGNDAGGSSAMNYNSSGFNNSALGNGSLVYNTAGSAQTAIGLNALKNSTSQVATLGTVTGGTGYTNGTYTGVVMTRSSGSTAATYPTATIVVAGGVVSTVTITSGGVAIQDTTTVLTAPAASIGGTGSGFTVPVASLSTGVNNTALGYQAGLALTTGSNNTVLGYAAAASSATISNEITLGNASVTAFRIPALTITAGAKWINVGSSTVALLPAAATAGLGARAFVTDALTPAFGSAVVGGGAVAVPVYSDGTSWLVG